MKVHNGMRPQDIVILLKIISLKPGSFRNKDLAVALNISPAEISESLERSRIGGLIDGSKRQVFRNSLLEFLIYGLKYVFPASPGEIVRGIPTAFSAPPLNKKIRSNTEQLVWPMPEADFKGQAIVPLYKSIPGVILQQPGLYELLALVDAVRVGRVREVSIAIKELSQRINSNVND